MTLISKIKGFIKKNSGSLFYSEKSYSQEGEDLVLRRFFDGKKKGFYVEVGCHHPFKFSNTYLFYKKGWSGICVDPLPGTIEDFRKWRPRDIVMEIGISNEKEVLTYHMFNKPALNTFDEKIARERDGLKSYKIVEEKTIPVTTLSEMLRKNLPQSVSQIDFLSIDVEGYDLAVLKSNDWDLFRPRVVVVECLKSDLHSLIDDPVSRCLVDLRYVPYAKTGNSVIFVFMDKGLGEH